jgi:hypothetical protein
MSDQKRTFKLVASDIHVTGGRYTDTLKKKAPRNAAKKAGAQVFKALESTTHNKSKGLLEKKIKIVLQETTRGSEKKIFSFNVWKVILDVPITRVINGVSVSKTYEILVETCEN